MINHSELRQENRIIQLEKRKYYVKLQKSVIGSPLAPRLVIVAYQPNKIAKEILRVAIKAYQHYTSIPHELWVVDNNSPSEYTDWLLDWPDINVVLNRTQPRPHGLKFLRRRAIANLKGQHRHPYEASYDNAIALELAVRLIDPECKYLITLHMDTLPCHPDWLTHLKIKIDQGYAAAGLRMEYARLKEGVIHVLGLMVDYPKFRSLGLDFMPALPDFDVGDRVTVNFRTAGERIYCCRNSVWQPELLNLIPADSPLRNFDVNRSFDDNDNVIFLHLGRGVRKSTGEYLQGTSPKSWIDFAQNYLLTTDLKTDAKRPKQK